MSFELDDFGGAKELAVYRLTVAREDLEVAKENFQSGHYRASNNRAYYAVFRAISACLALKFKSFKQHSQVIGNFNKDFVHTGIFPKDISRKISQLQEVRHASDYDDFYLISKEDALMQVDVAEEIVTLIGQYFETLD